MAVKCLLAAVGAALAITAATANATSAGPGFTHPWKVARAMEAHYNSTDFKRRLGKYGWQNVGRVLCAPDDASPDKVDCSGRQRFRANGKWVPVQSGWSLRKLSATRARFSWWWEGSGDGDSGDEIVNPAAFELTRF